MNISQFVKSMLPFVTRSRVQDDLRNTTNELNTLVVPTVQKVAKELKGPFKSPQAKTFMSMYKLSVSTSAQNYAVDLAARLPKLLKTLEAISNVVNSEFDDKVVSAGMSVRKANAIRLVSVISFINKFTMSLLNATLHYELEAAGVKMEYVSDVTPGEMQRLSKYFPDYAQFLSALDEVKNPDQAFADIPEVLVEAEALSGVFGPSKVDPFRIFGQSQFRGNPFYLVGMMVAEYQNNQYRKMEAQKQALEKRLIAIHRAQQGQTSAQAEKELEVLSSRIANIAEEMRKYEESLA